MDDKPFDITGNLYFDNKGVFEPLTKAPYDVFNITSLNETTEVIKDFNRAFSFTIRKPPLQILRLLGAVLGSRRNPIKAKEVIGLLRTAINKSQN